MKSPNDVKKGLRCLSHDRTHTLPCSGCEYHGQGLPPCRTAVHEDAIALTEQLEAENKRYHQENTEMYAEMCMLREKVHRLEAERDALYEEVRRCFYCIHVAGVLGECDQHCESCNADCPCKECDHYNKFEWRGVQKEDSDDGKE